MRQSLANFRPQHNCNKHVLKRVMIHITGRAAKLTVRAQGRTHERIEKARTVAIIKKSALMYI